MAQLENKEMNIEEAIQDIKEIKTIVGGKSLEMAISALEKQMPKKPSEQSYAEVEFDSGTDYLCPECKALVGGYSDDMEEWIYQRKHCEDCGQKIDWSEVQE